MVTTPRIVAVVIRTATAPIIAPVVKNQPLSWPRPFSDRRRGFATITVNLETRTLFASVYVDRLHHVTMAHIHMKEGDTVVVPLFQYPHPETKTGYIFRGYASLQGPVKTMSQFLHLLRAGELFLNVHTTTHPKGEISGFLKTMIYTVGHLKRPLPCRHCRSSCKS